MSADPSRGDLQVAPRTAEEIDGLELLGVRLAQLAASICQAPLASLALPTGQTSWCTATGALPAVAAPRRDPFADLARPNGGLVEIEDANGDARFRDAAHAGGPIPLRFYAGITVCGANGAPLGRLAVYDRVPRRLTLEQHGSLTLLAQLGALQSASGPREMPQTTQPSDSVRLRAQLLRAIENAPVALYHTDDLGNVTYANPEFRRVFGLRPDQSTNEWIQGVHPEDRTDSLAVWNDFCRNPRPVRFEYRTLIADSGVRHVAEHVVPAEGASGYIGTITDVTDLVALRGDLNRAERLFRDTFEQAPIGIAYADRAGRFVRCNAAFCTMLGFEPGELEGRTIGELTFGEDLAHTNSGLARLWQGDIPFVDIEKRYSCKDGTTLWVRVTTALVHEGSAGAACSVEFLRDISVRKHMAAELLQNQALLETVIAELPVGLLACDVAGEITHYNRVAADLCGIRSVGPSRTGATGIYPLPARIYLADGVTMLDPAQQPLARALRGDVVSNLELVTVPAGATPRTTLSSARQMVGPDGESLGAVAVIQDTTERKLADLELERVHRELLSASRQAGMAEVATNVLHNVGNILNSVNISASLVAERIKQSKAPGLARVASLLKEQGARLGEFLATDERGRSVPAYLETLARQLLSDQQLALGELASLRENLEHIKDTVAMQQSYAKLCGVTETVKVADLVEDSLRLNAGAFVRHGVTLAREFNDVPPIVVDKHKVLQILVNLVRNAKYACDESGRLDKLITLRIDGDASGVRIAVIDNGAGILPENMSRIFTHGFTTRQAGHGFGLHSGALAAQELGGSLRAESAGHGCGATFTLTLPLAPREGNGHG